MGKRYVYGTRSKKWHLVERGDRDYRHGLTPKQKRKLGKRARDYYLGARQLR